ncbi:MAG: 6-carboxytetrahydropterin synthase [Planctomycetes bacterium]|nr:6-carboxytetrahydropterin synthase [Planctomycetota bacterium]
MSTFEVSVRASFRAAHALPLGGGGMEESHEHSWETTATFRSARLDSESGFVIDFLTVRDALGRIASRLDGRDLNTLDAFGGVTTSAENVAASIAGALMDDLTGEPALYRLAVTEAPGCVAAYYPGDP